ncbi:toprim domain-containing protein [Candidatus Undinarchaeota archaeon]
MIEEKHRAALEKLKSESAHGIPILAEGPRDRTRLKEIGIEGEIILIQGKSMVKLVEELENLDELIILTDFDRTGARKCSQLRQLLERQGVKVNIELRKQIFSTTFARQVEELKPIQ